MVKGVSFDKSTQNWKAWLTVGGKKINLGSHSTKVEAANACNKATLSLSNKKIDLPEHSVIGFDGDDDGDDD